MSGTASRSGRESRGARRWPSLTTLIFVSVGLGISCGVFLGEIAAPLKFLGDAYVGLLQMTVLPYIVVSLIASIGRLSVTEGRLLARYGLIVLLALWGLSAATVVVMALALPPLEVGAFFSTSLIEAPAPVNHLDIYIPSNPFNSLSSNYVPAVVLFFGLFGIAIMKVRGKEALISQLEIAALALRRINGFVINLTPVGVFAISASAFGTLSLEELGRLQGYLLTFTAAVLFLTFLVMPLLVAAVTPFRYRDILSASRDALITAFVTGSAFVVIPLMIEGIRQLYEAANTDRDHADAHPEFIIPLGYAFPSSGKIVSLIFVPFAAWFYGESFGLTNFSLLLSAGLFLAFGKLTVAIPYLLEAERLPSDIFQLFLVSGVFAGRGRTRQRHAHHGLHDRDELCGRRAGQASEWAACQACRHLGGGGLGCSAGHPRLPGLQLRGRLPEGPGACRDAVDAGPVGADGLVRGRAESGRAGARGIPFG